MEKSRPKKTFTDTNNASSNQVLRNYLEDNDGSRAYFTFIQTEIVMQIPENSPANIFG